MDEPFDDLQPFLRLKRVQRVRSLFFFFLILFTRSPVSFLRILRSGLLKGWQNAIPRASPQNFSSNSSCRKRPRNVRGQSQCLPGDQPPGTPRGILILFSGGFQAHFARVTCSLTKSDPSFAIFAAISPLRSFLRDEACGSVCCCFDETQCHRN